MSAFYYWGVIEKFSSRGANRSSREVLLPEGGDNIDERHGLSQNQVEADPSSINTF